MKPQDQTARVVAQYRGKYRVKNDENEFWAEVTGKMMFNAEAKTDYPVVGDLVRITDQADGQAVIREILPRITLLQRKAAGKDEAQPIAANIDMAFIVQAVDQDYSLNRFERYLTIIRAGKIEPAVILNKTDLISETELGEKIGQVKERFHGIQVIATSATGNSGIEELRRAIEKGKIYCFVGSSGVGKSSIVNELLGEELINTREISTATKKGRHTTTHRELFVLENGGMVIDNPGVREVGVADAGEAVANVFDDITGLAKRCKFADCTHNNEPECAVLAALRSGELNEEKYLNFIKLKKESDYYALSILEKKQKDRSFGQMVKNFKKLKKNK